MNSVAPARRESSRSLRDTSSERAKRWLPARAPCPTMRGRSVGTSSSGGAPANRSRQYDSWASNTSPESHSRCHTAKSAYCTGSSASGSPA